MRIKINGDTLVSDLYHSDNIKHVDLDANELVHFKYIKREKLPNGKWRYYYDESELKAELNKANADRYNAAKKAGIAKRDIDKAFDNELEAMYNHHKAANKQATAKNVKERNQASYATYAARKKYNQAQEETKSKKANYEKAVAAQEKAIEKAKSAEKKYKTKKITSFPKRVLSKGAVTVLNVLSGNYKKKKKK